MASGQSAPRRFYATARSVAARFQEVGLMREDEGKDAENGVSEDSDSDDRSPLAKGFALASSILANAILLAGLAALGYGFDLKAENFPPYGTIVGALLGVLFFAMGIISTVKRFEER